MKINGVSLAAYGVTLSAVSAWRGRPERLRERLAIADGAGTAPGRRATQGARTLTANGFVGPADVATLGGRSAILDALERAVAGRCTLEFDDDPGRLLDAECTRLDVQPVNTVYGAPQLLVDMRWVADDTTKRDAEPLPRSFTGNAVAIPVGTAPHGGTVTIHGAATNPVLTCRGADGVARWSLTFTVTLGADDYLVINLDRRTVTRSDAGTETNGISTWTAGKWGVLSPADGDPEHGAHPTLEVSSGTGVHLGARRWLG